ncbi:hypothetical protein Q8A67_012037 [Cirrhinus molitorella]|uniref:Uncharacterized protein n=1 Tax=Cirrhinus molitorella TaxID=172907 RepID=A0AA88PTL6_9TELE|nr:hypothetical protein Q8A67_012037 [Cirrhinus molitorella]
MLKSIVLWVFCCLFPMGLSDPSAVNYDVSAGSGLHPTDMQPGSFNPTLSQTAITHPNSGLLERQQRRRALFGFRANKNRRKESAEVQHLLT